VSADLRVCTGTLPHGGIPCPRPGRPAGNASVPSAASLRVGIFHKPADQRVLTRFKLDLKGGRSVSEPRTVPRAPNGLARRGRVLWAELHTEFDFTGEPHRRVLVEDACREADLVDRLQRAVTKNEPSREAFAGTTCLPVPRVATSIVARQHRRSELANHARPGRTRNTRKASKPQRAGPFPDGGAAPKLN
jgi:hypothetical protein